MTMLHQSRSSLNTSDRVTNVRKNATDEIRISVIFRVWKNRFPREFETTGEMAHALLDLFGAGPGGVEISDHHGGESHLTVGCRELQRQYGITIRCERTRDGAWLYVLKTPVDLMCMDRVDGG